jgi:sugar (pentulose or hexulose) kinase
MHEVHVLNFYVGIDLGTSYTKALVVNEEGEHLAIASFKSKWSGARAGEAEGVADEFVSAALAAIGESISLAEEKVGHAIQIAGIGITGLAESGVTVDPSGRPTVPVLAWYDERGEDEMRVLAQKFKDDFVRKTGLSFTAQCSLGKVLYLHNHLGKFTKDLQWLNLQEYVAYKLTGQRFTMPSLASRTGFWNFETESPWLEALELVGMDASFIPTLRQAGQSFGEVNLAGVPPQIVGAVVTVAGHDHPVASVGSGALGESVLFNSVGTADVLLRTVEGKISDEDRVELVRGGVGSGAHVLPGKTLLLGGTRAGLILRRVLALFEEIDPDIRTKFDAGWNPDVVDESIVVSEPNFMSNEVVFTLSNEASGQVLWDAALRHNKNETEKLLQHINKIVGVHKISRAAGGWLRLRSVKESKATLMPGLTVSNVKEAGAFGAAAFARVAALDKFASIEEEISAFVTEKAN